MPVLCVWALGEEEEGEGEGGLSAVASATATGLRGASAAAGAGAGAEGWRRLATNSTGAGTAEKAKDPLWLYATIPIVSGLVGWGTNVVALKMTFYPIEFFGININRFMCGEDQPIGCIGWQGIIPAKAAKMAAKSVQMMTKELFDVKELFGRLDPKVMVTEFMPGLRDMMGRILGEVMRLNVPALWEALPRRVQNELVERSLEESPAFIEGFMKDIQENIEEVFDIEHMVVTHLTAHKEQLNNVFLRCGDKEFTFIERSGGAFGFLFGLPQAVLWYFYPEWWILPVAGFVVGYLTNWIALTMIFAPIEPVFLCNSRIKLQGVFLKRQEDVSREFAAINTEQMLNSSYMWDAMLHGARADAFEARLRGHCDEFVERLLGSVKLLLVMYLGAEGYQSLKAYIRNRTVEEMPNYIHHLHNYSDRALDMERTLREKMAALPPSKFEGVLHPVFQEDEIKLILVGGALGVMVGFFQAFVVFS